MKLRYIITLVLAAMWTALVHGATPLTFKPVPNIDAISNNTIVCMAQDSHGYLWLGTEHGLNRFDGYQVKTYLTDDQESKRIFSVSEDAVGNLWVTVGYGNTVKIYDREHDTFADGVKYLQDKGHQVTEMIRTFVDGDGLLWFSTTDAMMSYDAAANKLTRYPMAQANDAYSLVNHNGQVTVSTAGALMHLNAGAPADTIHVADERLRAIIDSRAHIKLYKDDNADMWLYALESPYLWRNEMYKPSFEMVELPSANFIINDVIDDHNGNIWVATNHEGVYRIDKTSGKIDNIIDKTAGTDGFYNISALLSDAQGNIWAGSYTTGVRMLRDSDRAVLAYSIPGQNVILLYLDSRDDLWVGVEGEGISIRHPNSYRDVDIPPCNVTAITEDKQGRIWIGTYLQGLYCYDNGEITSYTTENSTLPENSIYALYAADNGHLWLGTLNQGLIRFTGEHFTREFEDVHSVSAIDSDGSKLYVGSDLGLGILDLRTGKSEVLTSNRGGDVKFPSRHVSMLLRASDGKIWMGFAGGVVNWDPTTDKAELITTDEGMPGNLVSSMYEDNRGRVWVTTDRGLAAITYHPDGSVVRRYTKADGLLSEKTSFHSLSMAADGGLLVGTEGGFTFIDLSDADRDTDPMPVAITSVMVNKELLDGQYVVETGDHSCRITIPASLTKEACSVIINFSDFDYANIGKEQFWCTINTEDEWLPLTAGQIVFGQMRPGTYEVRVRRVLASGAIDPQIYTITIEVEPQFWASTWAKVIYALIALALIVIIVVIYTRMRRTRNKRRAEMEENKQLAEVNDLKMRFFTNVSHDLRTPLSLVITPLEELQKLDLEPAARKNVDVARRNADHLMSLVNQLLDFRRLDVNAESLNATAGDLVAFVAEQFRTFKDYSDNNRRNLRFHASADSAIVVFDKEKIKRVIYNLLSNALKYTPVDGNIVIDVWQDLDRVYVSVTDDGVGIPDDMKQRVFDPFCQVKGNDESITGSGIGLHIVKQYVEMHGGEITVTDHRPCGTVMTFWLPAAKAEAVDIAEVAEGSPADDRPTILVVEDNADFRNFVSDNLEGAYRVLRAANGREGLAMLDSERVDVIVTDVMMPEVNGIELCAAVKSDVRYSHIPVIMMTARVTDEQRIEGLESGADDYITKPFSIDLLRLRITKFLEWRHRAVETFNSKIDVRPSDITINHVDEEFVSRAIALVEENLANADFSVEEMAQRMSLSRTGLYRKISQLTGKTPLEFIQFLRLSHAKRMLQAGMSVSEVAYAVGYNQPKYFSKQFHDVFGCTPTEYKKTQTADDAAD